MANSKLKLIKILEILSETDEEHTLTAVQIGKKLERYGIDAERKSICRDIHILKDDAGYDIVLSPDNKQGYYMASHHFEDWELKVLIDAVWSSKFLTQKNAETLAKKLYAFASIASRKLLSPTPPITQHKSSNITTKIYIEDILMAIKTNRKIKYQYSYTSTDMKPQLRRDGFFYTVNPYALILQNEHYYLISNYDLYNNLSYYRLDRIKNLTICNETKKPLQELLGENSDAKLEKFVRSSIYHYSGDDIRLSLQVEGYMVDELIDYFGTDLHFSPTNKAYQVTVNVQDGDGLYYWLLQHEQNVKVLAPDCVKTKLIEKARGILKMYEV